jgi:hypothetical protein
MNALQRHIQAQGLSEVETMDRLQLESNTISDCAVWAADVPGKDCVKAVRWLEQAKALDAGVLF